MMRFQVWKLILLGVIALAAELTVLSTWTLLGARMELLFILACFAALYARKPEQAVWACWILGLLKDLGGGGPFGMNALLFLTAGVFVLQFRQIVFREHPLTQGAVAAAGATLLVLVDAVATMIFAGRVAWDVVLARSFGAAVFTGMAAPLLIVTITRPKWLLR